MRSYAKKRVTIRAVQWPGGRDMILPLLELLGQRGGSRGYNVRTGQLELSNGVHANIGDWICSPPDGEIFVISGERFHELYEEIDEANQPETPTDAAYAGVVQLLTQELDTLLIHGLRLSLEENPSIFYERNELLLKFHRLLIDNTRIAARHERQRVKNMIANELVL